MKLQLAPIEFKDAAAFVRLHHRHHTPPVGRKFSVAALQEGELVGVVIVGRPVSRMRDDGHTLEVTRLCTIGNKNACSMLYGAAARAGNVARSCGLDVHRRSEGAVVGLPEPTSQR